MGCHALLQGIFPTQGSSLSLPHWQVGSLPLSHSDLPQTLSTIPSPIPTSSVLSSVAQSCPTLCDPRHCSTPGFPVHHQLLELAQTHVDRVGDAIQPAHPPSSPSPAFSLSHLLSPGLFPLTSDLSSIQSPRAELHSPCSPDQGLHTDSI